LPPTSAAGTVPLTPLGELKLAAHARRMREHRARVRRSAAVFRIEIDAEVVAWLAKTGWLDSREAYDSSEIAAAVTAMLKASATAGAAPHHR
jgi:hypothetical protein